MPDGQGEDPFVWLGLDEISPASDLGEPSGFDEEAYLTAFPDVAMAVRSGVWSSARQHYEEHGSLEFRLQNPRYLAARATRTQGWEAETPVVTTPVAGSVDVVFATRTGRIFVVGWVDDSERPILDLAVCNEGDAVVARTGALARCRRLDAEATLGGRGAHLLGFWAVLNAAPGLRAGQRVTVKLRMPGADLSLDLTPSFVSDLRLREVVFSYIADAAYFGNAQVESFMQFEGGIGRELTSYNREISTSIIKGAHVARFGPEPRDLEGSIIVCLYGKAEFLFLQAALFTCAGTVDHYEFIYVSNSPDLAEVLQREAAIAARVYGVSITLVILPDNAGFGAANNAAARHARSRRLLIVNPDVFPRDGDWARRHSAVVTHGGADQTRIFGVPLYYDDGSLMHGGLYFEMDEGWSIRSTGIERRRLARVEHIGKGASPTLGTFTTSRRVPGVTGAFISIERDWFEMLDGFSLDFVFGHYEDADLCLKSLAAGQPVWMHNVPFWHLEGKGSTRLPVHEGGSLVNRWYFTSRWGAILEQGLLGKCSPNAGA